MDKLDQTYCNKCGFVGVPDGMGFHARPSDGEQCNYLCRSFTPANGEQVDLAHELWALAQLGPNEGIEDGAARIAARLASTPTEDARERVKVLEEALERAKHKLGHVSAGCMNGDNLAVTLCTHFDDDEEQPEDEDAYLDECGMMYDGCCTLAGTEFCDWDCPRNRPNHLISQGADHDLPA